MKLIIRILITSALVVLIANFMTGVRVDGFTTALDSSYCSLVTNIFIKPIIVYIDIANYIYNLGTILLVINAIIILLCDNIVGGFSVDTFWTALLFSIILSLLQSMYQILRENK
jgi:putative membrane protein